MNTQTGIDIRNAVRMGLIAGCFTLSVSAIGMVALFSERELISGVVTMGQVLIFMAPITLAYLAVRNMSTGPLPILLTGLITGAASSLPTIALIVINSVINLRPFMPSVSPALMDILTFGQGPYVGSLIFLGSMGVSGLVAAAFRTLPTSFSKPIFTGILWTLVLGLFSEFLASRMRDFLGSAFSSVFFRGKALVPLFGAGLFLAIAGGNRLWAVRGPIVRQRLEGLDSTRQNRLRIGTFLAVLLALILLPQLLGSYLSEVSNTVGIYILMGLGLNIVVGFAGLLDLGYVAFFAIGAYSMAVLTTQGSLGIGGLNFWEAVPFCILMAAAAGIVLGVPVLRMRGDYLAIVTLGFGEIIGRLALSDMLKPWIGGAQGVLKIPKPPFLGLALVQPGQFYYVVLAGCLLAAFVSYRLADSRLGRQWMAMREDEDVAEAMGIKLVSGKLLAFSIGAAFSGLSGALFASKLTSIFPHSFNLIISINVLCLIIIGGMGSLPGVVVGALVLVGLPELLREFAEYRLLMYGALLVAMMLAKPEGFIPSAVRQRELRADEEVRMRQQAAPETGA
jgi:branched-chain amino acid transport system permease protein